MRSAAAWSGPVGRARLAAGLMLAGAAALAALRAWLAAAALAAGAVLVLAVVRAPPAPAGRPGHAGLDALLAGLALEGRPVAVPPGWAANTGARLFVPARDCGADEIPPLDDATVLWRGSHGVAGVSLPLAADLDGVRAGGGAEAAAVAVAAVAARRGLPAARLESAPGTFRVELPHGDAHPSAGCEVCGEAAAAVAHAVGAPLALARAAEAGGRLELAVLAKR